jgi:hypothetical protein
MMAEAATAIGDGAPPPSPRSPSGYVSPRYVPIWRSAAACRRRRRCCCCCRRCCFLSIMMVAIDTPRLALTRARLYAGRRPRCRLAHTPPQPGATDCPQRAATLAATVTAAAVTTTLPQRHRLAGHARGGRLMAEPRQRLAEVSEGHLRAPMQCRRGSRNLRPPTSRCRPHLVALWGRPRRTGSNVKIRIFCSVRFFSPLPPTDSPLSTGRDASSSSSFPKPSLPQARQLGRFFQAAAAAATCAHAVSGSLRRTLRLPLPLPPPLSAALACTRHSCVVATCCAPQLTAGSYSAAGSTTQYTEFIPGYADEDSDPSTSCTECVVGHEQIVAGQTTCTPCAQGMADTDSGEMEDTSKVACKVVERVERVERETDKKQGGG